MRLLSPRPITNVLRNNPRAFFSSSSSSSKTSSSSSSSIGSNREGGLIQQPVRWGILSAGKISSEFSKAISITDNAVAHAVAARNGDKAAEFAQQHRIPKSYGSYEELLQDPEIDVVYVGSIADQHYRLASLALKYQKPTLVEKPLTLTQSDTARLVQLARQQDTFFQEAMWTRFFPAMVQLRELIRQGEIGKVVCIQGDFGWCTDHCDADNRIWYPQSGGMTLDIGMYLAQFGQAVFGAGPSDIQTMATLKHGVDHTTVVNVQYEDEGFLQFYVTGEGNTEERVIIQGTKGRIVIDPPAHVPSRLRLFRNVARGVAEETVLDHPLPDGTELNPWHFPGSVGLTYQVAAIGDALRKGQRECEHFTQQESIEMAGILDTILAQVQQQHSAAADVPQSA